MSTTTWPPRGDPDDPASGRRRPQTAARARARAARIAGNACSTSAASDANTREIVGSEATEPNTSGCARTAATSATQSPPSATAVATSSSTLPGSCTARAGRHDPNAVDNSPARPESRTVC